MVKKGRISILLKEGQETQFLSGLAGWSTEEPRSRFKKDPQVEYRIKEYIFTDPPTGWQALDNVYRCESSQGRIGETLSLLTFFLKTSAMASLSAVIEDYCDGIDVLMNGLTPRSNEGAFRRWDDCFPAVDNDELHAAWITSGKVNQEDYIRLYSSHPDVLTRSVELGLKLRKAAEKDYPVSLIADAFRVDSSSYEEMIELPAAYISKIYGKTPQVLERGWEGSTKAEEEGVRFRIISMYEPSKTTLFYLDPFKKFQGEKM